MRIWHFAIASTLFLPAAGGCRLRQLREANQALERENFCLEQRCDELTFQLEDAQAALKAQEGDLGSLRRQPESPLPSRGRDRGRTPILPEGTEVDMPPNVEMPDEDKGARLPGESAPAFEGPPIISPPDPKIPEGIRTRPTATSPARPEASESLPAPEAEPVGPGGGAPSTISPKVGRGARLLRPHLASQGPRAEAATLVIDAERTTWHKGGEGADDQGLLVVVEARDAAGNPTALAGTVAIVAIDPSQPNGPQARVARWDFAPADVQSRFHGIGSDGGLQFELDWPRGAPKTDTLVLFVRLTMADGRQLVAEHELRSGPQIKPTAAEIEQPATPAAATSAAAPSSATAAKGWQRAKSPPPERLVDPQVKPASAAIEAPAEPAAPTAAPVWEPYR
ncbi:MAG: hypothetical protein HYX69_12815 [Planctomycetia bacterium]|nr:hypothetical protein [Planctomycetia bacterium]